MTEKQLRDDIIVKMLDYRDKYNVDINEFCNAKNITFSSDNQRTRIFEYLNTKKYIKCLLYGGDKGHFTITLKGVQYAKEVLELRYATQENNKKIIDNSVEPCFNVESLAECYVDLIDRACYHRENNVCLFGIFAPWGRGKSYFFKKVKEYINVRKDSKTIQYDIVEFNAWKYQETPAIWAYLFETLYNFKGWSFKFFYTIKRNWESIISDLLIYSIPIIIIFFISAIDCLYNININKWYSVTGFLSASLFICKLLLKHYNSALSIMKKYSKGISFANELGVQAEIEKEITFLLEFWIDKKNFILKFFIRKRIRSILKLVIYLRRMYITRILSGKKKRCCNKKVILYIDDIDRCSETKMTSIIDSLRTVLENEEIRKRLIIICSIDPQKIIKGIEYKYQTLYNEKELRSIAIDQMDKIFLTGIALSPLDKDQILEFVSKLAEVDNRIYTIDGKAIKTIDNSTLMVDKKKLLHHKMNEYKEFNDFNIYKLLENLIKDHKKQLTPRKIRIIYYRILLANNIICKMEDPKITKALIQNIFSLSVGNKIEESDKDDELSDILNMVVPYRYNEENEVSSESEEKTVS